MWSPKLLHTAALYQAVSAGLLATALLFIWPEGAVGALAGGALMAGNFWLLRVAVTKLMAGGGHNRAKLLWGLLLAFKLVVLLALLALFVIVLDLHPVGLAAGMFTLFLALVLASLHQALLGPRPAA